MRARDLMRLAEAARERAYAPYSDFLVGAALLGKSGKVYLGCNVENAGYSATNCAERTAFFKAISDGEREFQAIAIVGGKRGEKPGFCAPCGICRQVMRDFADKDELIIICAKSADDYIVHTLEEMLPKSFGPEAL